MQYVLNKNGSVTLEQKKKKEKETPKQGQLKAAVDQVKSTIKNSAVRNQGLNVSNAITDIANLNNAGQRVMETVPIVGNMVKARNALGRNVTNAATNLGIGATKSIEGISDAASDIIFNPIERKYNYAYDYLRSGKKVADENLKDLIKMQERDIKKNRTDNFLKKTGYNDVADELEEGSLIKRGNVGGQVAQGLGGMVPALVLGGAFGGTPELANTSSLAGKEKLLASLGNVGRTYAAQAPSNLALGASSYGSGMEEALNDGATMEQARKYGLLNAAIEQGTEMLTGGVPGLGGRGSLDDIAEGLINRGTGGITNAGLKYLYKSAGEGLEEYAGAMLDPLAKKVYSDEPIDWNATREQARQAGLVGGLTGAVLNGPEGISNINSAINENRANRKSKLDNLTEQSKNTLKDITTKRNNGEKLNEQDISNLQEIRKEANTPQETVANSNEMVYNEGAREGVVNGRETRGLNETGINQQNGGEQSTNDSRTSGERDGGVRVLNETTDYKQVKQNIDNLKATHKRGAFFDTYTEDEFKTFKTYQTPDGKSSISVKPDGDITALVSEGKKGMATDLLMKARENGGTKMDCYGKFLKELYEQHGFKAVARVKYGRGFNEQMDAYVDNAIKEGKAKNDSDFDIYFMMKNTDDVDTVRKNVGKYETTDADSLPVYEYDEAYKLRDDMLSEQESGNPNLAERVNDNAIKSEEFKEAIQKVKNGTATEKERSYIKTATESQNTEEMTKQMDETARTYEVLANEKTLMQAEAKLSNKTTLEDKARYINDILVSDKRLNASDMAAAELVLKDAAAAKNTKIYNEVLANLSIYATEQGQSIQALSLIKKMSPTSQLDVLEKIINREKAKGNKAYSNLKITEEMRNRIFECYDENGKVNQEQLDNTMEEIKQELADNMKVGASEKIRAWRYLSMLGNPKTHIRNMVANVAMSAVKTVEDTMSAATQDIFIGNRENKTKTLKSSSDVVKNYTDTVYKEVSESTFGNKYNEKGDLENRAKTFNTRWLEAVRKFNDTMLSKEDQIFKKANFKKSFSNYLTAQGISTQEDIKNNPQIVEKAKLYAIEEANVATFNQKNKLSEFINSGDNKLGTGYKIIRGAIIPFTRTPLNIAKAGLQRTPGVGLAPLAVEVHKAPANQKANILIDGLSKQVTGSALALLGYALAKSGRVTAETGDDKDEKFEKDQGSKMDFSIKIGDKSYDLSWLSPSSMPFFVGARMFEVLDKQEGINENIILESLASTLDPLSEMSCISSFTKILQSYQREGAGMIKDMGISTMQNYLSQFVPTVSGQFARIFDTKKRTTSADTSSPNKISQETYRTLAYKIPGLRNTLPETTDYLGRTKEEDKNFWVRSFNAMVNPANIKKDTMTKEGKEIIRLYNKTGNKDILPSGLSQTVKFNDKDYKMTRKEYNEYKKDFGKAFENNLKELMNSQDYKNASDDEKAEMISGIMAYSKDKTKNNYLTEQGEDYRKTLKDGTKSPYESEKVDMLTGGNFSISDYYIYKTNTPNIVNGEYEAVRNRINTINTFGIDSETYSKYMEKIGNIKGSDRKRQVFEYINSLDLTPEQKNLLMKKTYYSYRNYDREIFNKINDSDLTLEEKESLKNFLKIGK